MNALSRFEAKPGIPGPRHGFYYQKQSGRLFVRLRADGKYGSPDPNEQIMAVSPPVRPQGDEEKPDSRSFNFGLFGKPGEALHVVLDGLTFEMPGASAVYVSGSHVTVRNSLFSAAARAESADAPTLTERSPSAILSRWSSASGIHFRSSMT